MFDVPVLGTHAHSWIMSFPDEYTAFKTYAKLYPNACTLLVDTYDVLKSGVPNAIRVFEEMREEGIPLTKYGIRIDSGDLAYLSNCLLYTSCSSHKQNFYFFCCISGKSSGKIDKLPTAFSNPFQNFSNQTVFP